MLVRVAACAAWFFVCTVCAGINGGSLSFPGVAVAMAQEMAAQEMAQRQAIAALHQNVDAEVKTRVAPRQDANVANAGTGPVPVNRAVSPETAPAPKAEPFGLRKWTGVESEIREDKQILAHCREDASSCPLAAQRFLAIVDEGRARSGRARIGVIKS